MKHFRYVLLLVTANTAISAMIGWAIGDALRPASPRCECERCECVECRGCCGEPVK